MTRILSCLAAAALACALVPAAASAHAIMRVDGGVLYYDSPDSVSLNRVVVVAKDAATLEVQDPTVSGGIDPGPCTPVTEYVVDCPSSSVASVVADLGPRNDRFQMDAPLPTTIYGGPDQDQMTGSRLADVIDGGPGFDVIGGREGDDILTGREGEDQLDGGPGNDVLIGSEETDGFDGGAGDDDIRSRDGVPENVTCGDGNDRVTADPIDIAGLDCERVERAFPGSEPPPEDTPPVVSASGRRTQRVARSKKLSLSAASNKAGRLTAYTQIAVFNLRYRLAAVNRKVGAGSKVSLRPRITASVMRQVKAAWKKRERVTAIVRVQATDVFGNRSVARKLTIRLPR